MLETIVKNCGRRFHVLLAKKELLDELVKVLNPKVDCFGTKCCIACTTDYLRAVYTCTHLWCNASTMIIIVIFVVCIIPFADVFRLSRVFRILWNLKETPLWHLNAQNKLH